MAKLPLSRAVSPHAMRIPALASVFVFAAALAAHGQQKKAGPPVPRVPDTVSALLDLPYAGTENPRSDQVCLEVVLIRRN